MDYNYHTHSCFCDHATGTMQEYIEIALKNSVKYFGFSEHAPLKIDNMQASYRMQIENAPAYFEAVAKIKAQYADKIEIIAGLEMEYYDSHFEEMLKNAREFGAEYLILGQHHTKAREQGGKISYQQTEDVETLKEYCDSVVKGIKSGVFTYLAHPDLINFVGDADVYKREMARICAASKERDIPLEINCLGIRENRIYPRKEFWEVAAEYKSPVTIGFDSHDVLSAYDENSVKTAFEMIDELKLNYIGKPEIIFLTK